VGAAPAGQGYIGNTAALTADPATSVGHITRAFPMMAACADFPP